MTQAFRRGLLPLLLILCAALAAHGLAGAFDKRLHCYPDELKYFSIARGIAMGHGISVRGEAMPFQKVAYPIAMAPLLRGRDISGAIVAVNWMNSVLAMASALFAWLIGAELGLRRRFRLWLALITSLWPETCATMTFMSENLYWPMTLCFAWLWLAARRHPSAANEAMLGAFAFAAYLCKESFLAMAAPAAVMATTDALRKSGGGGIPGETARSRAFRTLAFPAAFIFLFAATKATVFSGMGHSYHQSSPAAVMSLYNACYMAYAFLYFIAAILASLLVAPFAMPVAFRSGLPPQARMLLDLTLAFLAAAALGTAYSVSIREDLGALSPRVHMRYVAPALVLVMAVFMSFAQTAVAGGRPPAAASRRATLFTIAAAIFTALVFKGPSPRCSISDQACLGWTEAVRNHFFNAGPSRATFHLGLFLVSMAIILAAVALCAVFAHGGGRALLHAHLAALLAITLYNDRIRVGLLRSEYAADPALESEILALDEFLWPLDRGKSVLCFVMDERIGDFAKHLDTFLHLRCDVKFLFDTRDLASWDIDAGGADAVVLCSGGAAHRGRNVDGGMETYRSDSFTVFKPPTGATYVTVSSPCAP